MTFMPVLTISRRGAHKHLVLMGGIDPLEMPAADPHLPHLRTSVCRFFRHSGTCREPGSACKYGIHVLEPLQDTHAAHISERTWVTDELIGHPAKPVHEQSFRFSICCYNILADKYARQYRSWLYNDVPSSHLDWHHRRGAIIAELAHLSADVICLQEVDRYDDLESELSHLGYSGLFLQRDGGRRDGCATFWRNSLLRPALVRQLRYSQYDLKDNVALLVLFEPLTASEAAAAAAAQQQQQQQGRVLQPQQQPQQQQQQQDLLSQWLPKRWLSSHRNQQKQQQQQQHSFTSGCGSSSLYQWPADLSSNRSGGSNISAASSITSQGCRHSSKPDSRSAVAGATAVGEAAADSADAGPSAPDWLQCCLLVANTHIIFAPEKGDVKLGQARLLVQEAADMADYYLQQQQHQQQQLHQHQQHQQQAPEQGMCFAQPAAAAVAGGDQSSATAVAAEYQPEDATPHNLAAPSGEQVQHHRAAASSSSRSSHSSGNNTAAPAVPQGGRRAHAVATVIAGDFNAVPHSPMYRFLSSGQLDLCHVSRRHVAHVGTGGSRCSGKGYRGFRRAATRSRRSLEEAAQLQRLLLSQQRGLDQQQQQPEPHQQQQPDQRLHQGQQQLQCKQDKSDSRNVPGGSAAAVGTSPAALLPVTAVGAQGSESASSSSLFGGSCNAAADTGQVDPPPGRVWLWQEREVRRAAGCSTAQLAQASAAAAAAAVAQQQQGSTARQASPGVRISRAAAAFGLHVAAGAGAAAAARAAAAAAAAARAAAAAAAGAGANGGSAVKPDEPQLNCDAGSAEVAAARLDTADPQDTAAAGAPGPLLLRHGLKLKSSYASLLGVEPQYTSSHALFMDTCDYIWYAPDTITGRQQQGQESAHNSPAIASSSSSSSNCGNAAGASRPVSYKLRPVAVLNPVDGLRLTKGLPARWMGSDHVSLVADFELTPETELRPESCEV